MLKFVSGAAAALFATGVFAQDMPDDQIALRDAVVTAREAYDAALNDLAKGGLRPKRGLAVCEALPTRQAQDWVGTVYDLFTNGDGWGVVSIEMDGEIWISTWNNAMSDQRHKTLIDPASPLFTSLSELTIGQTVTFSGTFFEDDLSSDCLREKSPTLHGSMSQPEYVFAFTDVRPAP
jgi:hypothetical protein